MTVPKKVYEVVVARDKCCVTLRFARPRYTLNDNTENPYREAFESMRKVRCSGKLDPHHVTRAGQQGPDVPENLVLLCRAHHDWVHHNVAFAQLLGLLRRSGNPTTLG